MNKWIWIATVLLVVAASGTPICAADWPGWRGDGSGVARDEVDLPLNWGPDQNILWKTPIVGKGLSSPVVWGDNVFVTTAHEGSSPTVYRSLTAGVLILLVIVALGESLRIALKSASGANERVNLPGWLKSALLLDRIVTTLALGIFSVLVLFLSYKLLFDPEYIALKPVRAWLRAGKMCLFGLIAAVGLTRPQAGNRLLGALMLVAGALAFYGLAPYNKDAVAAPKSWLLLIGGALTSVALWHAFLFFATRHRVSGTLPTSSMRLAVRSLALVAAVLVTFYSLGQLQRQAGLVRSVVCLDRDTGEIRWQRAAFRAEAEPTPRNSRATPTVATDGEIVVAYFGHGVVGMDLDGNVKWLTTNPDYPIHIRYGVGSSPIIVGDKVIYPFFPESGTAQRLQGEDISKIAYLAALDKDTGEEIWRARPPLGVDTYSTPRAISHGGRELIIVPTWEHASAYDVHTGEQIWVVDLPLAQPVPTIVADETTVFVTGGVHGPSSATAIALGGTGNVTESHVKWQITTGVTGVSSPVLYQGLLYWITERGIIYCIDPETGERVWRGRIEEGRANSRSPVAGEGKVYVPMDNGKIAVIQAGREFKILATNDLGEDSVSSPAVADGRIFIRGIEHVFCVGGDNPS
jgi:outer membrane protein assembly factor BamB